MSERESIEMAQHGEVQRYSSDSETDEVPKDMAYWMDQSKRWKPDAGMIISKAKMLYIDAMREAEEDETFDPRRNEHVTGKDGRFVAQKDKSIPKNPRPMFF